MTSLQKSACVLEIHGCLWHTVNVERVLDQHRLPFFCVCTVFSAISALLTKCMMLINSLGWELHRGNDNMLKHMKYLKLNMCTYKYCLHFTHFLCGRKQCQLLGDRTLLTFFMLSVYVCFPFCFSLISLLWCLSSSHRVLQYYFCMRFCFLSGSLF